jgi:TatD DNase family protein
MLIDSHCHLDFPDFAPERDAAVARAVAAGVGRMITICTQVAKFPQVLAVAEAYENVWCTVGTHPHSAHVDAPEATVERLVALSRHPKVIGIGEGGLDYHYDKAPRDVAERVFRTQIAAARETGLPLVIHSRDADADMERILRDEMEKGAFKALLHCFTSSRRLAEAGLEMGLSISFSGVVTFKASDDLRAIARDVPRDRILVETDAPYLAPVPMRGKRNEPAFTAHTARVLAEVKGMSEADFAAATTRNVLALFDKMPPVSATGAA